MEELLGFVDDMLRIDRICYALLRDEQRAPFTRKRWLQAFTDYVDTRFSKTCHCGEHTAQGEP